MRIIPVLAILMLSGALSFAGTVDKRPDPTQAIFKSAFFKLLEADREGSWTGMQSALESIQNACKLKNRDACRFLKEHEGKAIVRIEILKAS